jgi:PiT family inorganic phosphate transporter
VLVLGGAIPAFEVPLWVMLACATAMTLGILSGGWRIVRTLGFAVYKVRPLHALDSQLTSAAVILSASLVGAPVSTSHVVASSIMGIGTAEHPRRVRWSKAGEIVATWAITIPASAVAGAALLLLLQPLFD